MSPVSRREAFVAEGRKSQDTIFENDTAGVKTEGVISRATLLCFPGFFAQRPGNYIRVKIS